MNTKILGHRGFKGKYPENTLMSFKAALDAGADGIELDIHYSKDKKIMVFHDFNLEALTGARGNIYDYHSDELRALKIGKNGLFDSLPSLEDVLKLVESYGNKNLCINVELKAGSALYPEIEKETIDLCAKYLAMDQYIFSSFDHESLATLKGIDPSLKTGVLTQCVLYKSWDYLKSLSADYYHPHYLTLMPDHLKALLMHQVKINTYTVNDPNLARSLFNAHIHSIITDNVSDMINLRKEVSF